jgi:hypothetical protein
MQHRDIYSPNDRRDRGASLGEDPDVLSNIKGITYKSTSSFEREQLCKRKAKIDRINALYADNLAKLNQHQRTVLVYGGDGPSHDGVDSISASNLTEKFTSLAPSHWRIEQVLKDELLNRTLYLEPKETIIVLPGGPASGYDRTLKDSIPVLAEFNREGADIATVCGSAFWTVQESSYEMNPGHIYTIKRSLVFSNVLAVGPFYRKNWEFSCLFKQDRTLSPRPPSPFEHRVARVTLVSEGIGGDIICSGGGSFHPCQKEGDEEDQEIEPILCYENGDFAAIRVSSPRLKDGRSSRQGVITQIMPHIEYDPEEIESILNGDIELQKEMPSTLVDIKDLKSRDPDLRETESFRKLLGVKILQGGIGR